MFVYVSQEIVYDFHLNGVIPSQKVIDQSTCLIFQFLTKHVLTNHYFDIEYVLRFMIEHNLTTLSW